MITFPGMSMLSLMVPGILLSQVESCPLVQDPRKNKTWIIHILVPEIQKVQFEKQHHGIDNASALSRPFTRAVQVTTLN